MEENDEQVEKNGRNVEIALQECTDKILFRFYPSESYSWQGMMRKGKEGRTSEKEPLYEDSSLRRLSPWLDKGLDLPP